jgi:hypothetical protein
MALFDHTVSRLAERPAVLFAADPPGDAVADLLKRYDPDVRPFRDRLVFRNGVLLYGPVEITPDIEHKAKLLPGFAVAYYTGVSAGGKNRRSEDLISQDAERMVRGLAARLGGTVHDQRPPMDLHLEVSVFSAQPLPVKQVVEVVQPYVDTGELVIDTDTKAQDAYFLVTEENPEFFVMYWPPRLSHSKVGEPPPAARVLHSTEPSHWDLRTTKPVAAASRELCLKVGGAALALAGRTSGIAVDTFGFPIDRAEDLLPP